MTINTMTTVPKVGDILYDSWGYDQTNIDYYEVVRVSKASVWIRSIAAELTDDRRHVAPVAGKYTDLQRAERIEGDDGMPVYAPCFNLRCQYRDMYTGEVEHDCPVVILVDNPPMRKVPQSGYRGEGYTVKTRSFSCATLWDGVPKYDTIAAGDPGH